MDEASFRQALSDFGGMSEEILAEADLMDILSPILRADFALVETYKFVEDEPLSVPITVFGAVDDDLVPASDLSGWRAHTKGVFSIRFFRGGHFFLDMPNPDVRREIVSLARAALALHDGLSRDR
jgi:medium-chain acyl-[acyl-carrier-protein] hydrolase